MLITGTLNHYIIPTNFLHKFSVHVRFVFWTIQKHQKTTKSMNAVCTCCNYFCLHTKRLNIFTYWGETPHIHGLWTTLWCVIIWYWDSLWCTIQQNVLLMVTQTIINYMHNTLCLLQQTFCLYHYLTYSWDPLSRGLLNRCSLKPWLHDGPTVAWLIKRLGAMGLQTLWTIMESHKITNEIAPNRDLTLKTRA